jgi:hypothetical protein
VVGLTKIGRLMPGDSAIGNRSCVPDYRFLITDYRHEPLCF